jgi:hypothetical protein
MVQLLPIRRRSVPLAARETAEGDEPQQGDDQPDPKAPDKHQHDPDDHDDAAEGDACDSTTIIRSSHAFLLLRSLAVAAYSPTVVVHPHATGVRVGSYSRSPTASRASASAGKTPHQTAYLPHRRATDQIVSSYGMSLTAPVYQRELTSQDCAPRRFRPCGQGSRSPATSPAERRLCQRRAAH